jgi:hypothetical protein
LTFTLLNINNIDVDIDIVARVAVDASVDKPPAWLTGLNDEDLQFLRRFLLSSGSLKAMAEEYGVSYPTVRARLDRLIAKVVAAEDPRVSDAFERKLRLLVADAKLPATVARELLAAHRAAAKENNQ